MKKTLFIISGHSNQDPGAVLVPRKESEETIIMKELLLHALTIVRPKDLNIEIWQDNNDDSLSTVISKVNKKAKEGDILLDIHFNAAGESAKGTEVFIKTTASTKTKIIANRIVELTSKMLSTPNRGIKLETQTRHKRLGILHSKAHSILWEVEFITNKDFMSQYDILKERLSLGIANILIQEIQ